jgi:hypothetical protein
MRILDMSAGSRSIWFNRMYPEAVYVDIREEVSPTVVADSVDLPFPDGMFDGVVFDPPHMVNGRNSYMAAWYGRHTAQEIREIVGRSGREAYRVTREDGWMAFKWNDHDIRLDHMLPLMEGWEPLVGHRVAQQTKHRSNSYWVLLRKRTLGYETKGKLQRVLALERGTALMKWGDWQR